MSKPKKEFLKNQLKSSINLKEARKREKRKQRIDRQKTNNKNIDLNMTVSIITLI